MSRALTTGCAGLAAMTSPLLIGIMVLLAVAAVTCPFLLEG